MQQGSAASWAKANSGDVRQIDPDGSRENCQRESQRAPKILIELAPGHYTVILEPSAVLDLVGFLFYDFSATAVDDKRSCLSGPPGKAIFGKNITITDDVYHPEQLGPAFDGEGLPRRECHSGRSRGNPESGVLPALGQKIAKQTHGPRFSFAERVRGSSDEPG